MRPSAIGRILFWRGGSLWIGLAGEATGLHAHHAVQIALPFPRGRVRLRDSAGKWTSYSAAIVPADEPHAFEARGQLVAQVFVDPESRSGRSLQLRYRKDGIVALHTATIARSIADLAASYEARAGDTALIGGARAIVSSLSGAIAESVAPTDERIERAVQLVREQIGGSLPLGRIASAVHLSPDRFRHLFVAETGVTFRAYVLWLRLEQSLTAYISGQSLTDAAFSGGFADSAHFSRTFRRMFGIAPASVRPE
jgi:AraC family transcriptional regulator